MAQSKAEAARRVNYHYMADVMRRLEWDLHQKILTEGRVPDAWHELARERGTGKRVRVTLMIEEDVLRFFRSLGEGYGPRMNRVLAGFMHARLAGPSRAGARRWTTCRGARARGWTAASRAGARRRRPTRTSAPTPPG